MPSIWNNKITVSVFGEQDSSSMGIMIGNLPVGEYIDFERITKFMRRMMIPSDGSPAPKPPALRIISGISGDRTTGEPLCVIMQKSVECVAEERKSTVIFPVRGNADYTGTARFRSFSELADEERYSERISAPLCLAGAICGQILERRRIYTGAHIAQLHNIRDNPFDPVNTTRDAVLSIRNKSFPVINDRRGWLMIDDMKKASQFSETLGGIVECATVNIPTGAGSRLFSGIRNSVALALFSIPSVAGVEFGSGFRSANMTGSQHSDSVYVDGSGRTVTKTNNHGGVIGGFSSGMPLVVRTAFAPMDYRIKKRGSDEIFTEPSVVPRLVVCVESAVNIAVMSCMMDYPNFCQVI